MTEAPGALSFIGMLVHADIVVQGVVAALVLGSIACWAIIFDKTARIVALTRAVASVEAFARHPTATAAVPPNSLLSRMLNELDEERLSLPDTAETRIHLEAALRAVGMRELRGMEGGLSFLATLASTAPFVGLFGTVWGIMHSFTSIAAAQDTSLASVAPGIAEALLATAVGLGAAIPAVVGYNQIRAAFARSGHRLAVAASSIARSVARGGR
jgi:biopolymer transport protein ExbB/TolQ